MCQARIEADLLALQLSVERAGAALACAFSSAEEFEAEVIRAQRARGAFDPCSIARLRLLLAATSVMLSLALVGLLI
jgi:hypothetical protein